MQVSRATTAIPEGKLHGPPTPSAAPFRLKARSRAHHSRRVARKAPRFYCTKAVACKQRRKKTGVRHAAEVEWLSRQHQAVRGLQSATRSSYIYYADSHGPSANGWTGHLQEKMLLTLRQYTEVTTTCLKAPGHGPKLFPYSYCDFRL